MKKHRLLKLITILFGAVYTPLGVFIGYSYGAENYWTANLCLFVSAILNLVDGCIFWTLIDGNKHGHKKTTKER